jgi:hypothetical protein
VALPGDGDGGNGGHSDRALLRVARGELVDVLGDGGGEVA